jgi:hypothetical protein
MARIRNYFEAGKIHYDGLWKGWALEIETFWGPEMATSEASAIWARIRQNDTSVVLSGTIGSRLTLYIPL